MEAQANSIYTKSMKRRSRRLAAEVERGFHGLDMTFAVKTGDYEVMAGTDSEPGLSARLSVAC